MLLPLLVLTSIVTVQAAPQRGRGGGGRSRFGHDAGTYDGQNTVASSPSTPSTANSSPVDSYPVQTQTQMQASPAPSAAQPDQSQNDSGSGNGSGSGSSSSGGGGSITNTCGGNLQMIEIVNQSGKTLYLDSGGDYTVSGCSSIAAGETCKTCQPAGGQGNIQVGLVPGGGGCGTWIESNTVGTPCTDVSIIPGYTVPIQCTASNGLTTGFTQSLCGGGDCSSECAAGQGKWDAAAETCQNPTGACYPVQGPAYVGASFFNVVGSAAYFVPYQGETARGVSQAIDLGFDEAWRTSRCVVYPQ